MCAEEVLCEALARLDLIARLNRTREVKLWTWSDALHGSKSDGRLALYQGRRERDSAFRFEREVIEESVDVSERRGDPRGFTMTAALQDERWSPHIDHLIDQSSPGHMLWCITEMRWETAKRLGPMPALFSVNHDM